MSVPFPMARMSGIWGLSSRARGVGRVPALLLHGSAFGKGFPPVHLGGNRRAISSPSISFWGRLAERWRAASRTENPAELRAGETPENERASMQAEEAAEHAGRPPRHGTSTLLRTDKARAIRLAPHSPEAIMEPVARSPRLRLRNLPFAVTPQDIRTFFDGYRLWSNSATSNIKILRGRRGRPTGQAVVYFADDDEARRAQAETSRRRIANSVQ
eukprot:GHVT01071778.1.p1 GENE.GHVT01071778.1~~GHVT01071778.1.p1  ORF type:complete len:215 (+),score=32.32 GHVT01071778.1:411-1055(+)